MEKSNKKFNFKINYKKMICSIFLIILIITLFLFVCFKIYGNFKDNSLSQSTQTSASYNKLQSEPTVLEDTTINFVAIGDVMCHSTNVKAAYNSETKQYDFSSVFKNIKKYTETADIAIRKSRNNFCWYRKRL